MSMHLKMKQCKENVQVECSLSGESKNHLYTGLLVIVEVWGPEQTVSLSLEVKYVRWEKAEKDWLGRKWHYMIFLGIVVLVSVTEENIWNSIFFSEKKHDWYNSII